MVSLKKRIWNYVFRPLGVLNYILFIQNCVLFQNNVLYLWANNKVNYCILWLLILIVSDNIELLKKEHHLRFHWASAYDMFNNWSKHILLEIRVSVQSHLIFILLLSIELITNSLATCLWMKPIQQVHLLYKTHDCLLICRNAAPHLHTVCKPF